MTVEYHGWITLRDSPGDPEEDRTPEIAARVGERLRDMEAEHRIVGMKAVNATYIVWLGGCTNHRSADVDEVFGLFHLVASSAPGSYGLLYVWDDETGDENQFRVWRLARGRLSEHADPFLSPCIPTIEDPLP